MLTDRRTGLKVPRKRSLDQAVQYFQIAAKAGKSTGASFLKNAFNAPPPDNRLYYMGLTKDEERAARYEKIRKTLSSYDYLRPTVDEIDQIVPLPPAKLPPWDGEIEWVKKWKKDEAPPLPGEERIVQMAVARNLNPETGLPVKIDPHTKNLLDPESRKSKK